MSERMWGFVLASLLTDLSNILEEGILLKVVLEVLWDRAEGLGRSQRFVGEYQWRNFE